MKPKTQQTFTNNIWTKSKYEHSISHELQSLIKTGHKGQASAELLIILAVSLTILIAVFSYSQTSITELNKTKLIDTAQNSVNDLINAADTVFLQGTGARKKIYYEIPKGTNTTKSGIEGKSIVINVLETDVFATAKTTLTGTLDTNIGGHFVWVTAKEGTVFFGTENITTTPTSIYGTLLQDGNSNNTLTITNNAPSTATIIITKTWTSTDINATLSKTSFTINSGANDTIDINFASNNKATGNHTGKLNIGISYTGADENITIPLNAEIISALGNLAIFPETHSISLLPSEADTNTFNACNTTLTALSNIAFTRTGTTATWINPITTLTTLPATSCKAISFTTTIPTGQARGNYKGKINATDSLDNTDSMDINVTVKGMADNFAFDWSTASFALAGRQLNDWNIFNSGNITITIDKMTISLWSTNDLDGATLSSIKLNNSFVWNTGGGTDGQLIDITNFSIPSKKSYTTNNNLTFSQPINDEGEDFQIKFTFTDGSTFTTQIYNP